MRKISSGLGLLTVILSVLANNPDEFGRFRALCSVNSATERKCHSALFSDYSYKIDGDLVILSEDLCGNALYNKYTGSIVAVNRGKCSFEEKTLNAQKSGFKALVILNDGPTFPMGASSDSFVSQIPVVLMETDTTLAVPGSHGTIQLSFGRYIRM